MASCRVLCFGSLVLFAVVTGCTSGSPLATDTFPQRAPPPQLSQPDQARLLLRNADGGTVVVDALTRVRFVTRAGTWTPWVSAGSLCVSEHGVYARESWWGDCRVAAGQSWPDIAGAAVENFDGAVSLVVVGVGTAITLAILTYAAMTSNDKGKGDHHHHHRRHEGDGEVIVETTTVVNEPVVSEPVASEPVEQTGPVGPPIAPLFGPEPADPSASPLLSNSAIRKSWVLGTASVEGGLCVPPSAGPCTMGDVTLGVRWLSFLEMRVGARTLDGTALSSKQRVGLLVGARLHGEFLDARRFALELGIDGGFLGSTTLVQGRWGVRWKVLDPFWLGLYPFNATYFSVSQQPSRVAFPSLLELSVDF